MHDLLSQCVTNIASISLHAFMYGSFNWYQVARYIVSIFVTNYGSFVVS